MLVYLGMVLSKLSVSTAPIAQVCFHRPGWTLKLTNDVWGTPEWQLVDLATHAYEMVSVSLYDTLGKDTVGEYDRCVSVVTYTDDPRFAEFM